MKKATFQNVIYYASIFFIVAGFGMIVAIFIWSLGVHYQPLTNRLILSYFIPSFGYALSAFMVMYCAHALKFLCLHPEDFFIKKNRPDDKTWNEEWPVVSGAYVVVVSVLLPAFLGKKAFDFYTFLSFSFTLFAVGCLWFFARGMKRYLDARVE